MFGASVSVFKGLAKVLLLFIMQ